MAALKTYVCKIFGLDFVRFTQSNSSDFDENVIRYIHVCEGNLLLGAVVCLF